MASGAASGATLKLVQTACATHIWHRPGGAVPVDIGDKPIFAPRPPAEAPKGGKSPLERTKNKG